MSLHYENLRLTDYEIVGDVLNSNKKVISL